MYNQKAFQLFAPLQRQLTARALSREGTIWPDVICLQEIESLIALRSFNETYLGGRYPYALLVDSRDLRQIDVAVLSKLEVLSIRSHVDDLDPKPAPKQDPWLFSRDCLEVELKLTGQKRLTLFINHFKSKYVDSRTNPTPAKKKAARKRGDEMRKRQAEGVRRIVRTRFPGAAFNNEWFAVLGDFNDDPGAATVKALVEDAGLEDVLDRIHDATARWTHWFRGGTSVGQLDYILLSPALAQANAGQLPVIERRGIGYARVLQDGGPGPRQTYFMHGDDDLNPTPVDFRFARFAEVTPDDYASDHCPVFLDV
jgi:endonuclease/exonuclease/phosphatase family metal-dependent hydrolase